MTLSDVSLIGKKILIGIVVALVPFLILFGGLYFTQKLLKTPKTNKGTSSLNMNFNYEARI